MLDHTLRTMGKLASNRAILGAFAVRSCLRKASFWHCCLDYVYIRPLCPWPLYLPSLSICLYITIEAKQPQTVRLRAACVELYVVG